MSSDWFGVDNKRFATHWRVNHRKDPARIPLDLCKAMCHHFCSAHDTYARTLAVPCCEVARTVMAQALEEVKVSSGSGPSASIADQKEPSSALPRRPTRARTPSTKALEEVVLHDVTEDEDSESGDDTTDKSEEKTDLDYEDRSSYNTSRPQPSRRLMNGPRLRRVRQANFSSKRTSRAVKNDAQYLTQEELNAKAKQVLPDPPPSKEHQSAITKAVKTVLSTPQAPPCCVCDAIAKPGEVHDVVDASDLPPSAEYVLRPPDDLYPDLAMEYDVSSFFKNSETSELISQMMLSPRGLVPSSNKADDPQLTVCKKCTTSLELTSRLLRKMTIFQDGSLSEEDQKKLYPPQLAIANGNFVGRWPEHLRKSEPRKAELALVSLYYNSAVLVLVHGEMHAPGGYKLNSHTSTYEVNLTEVISSLPLAPAQCPYRVLISGPRGAKLKELVGDRFSIRRSVVREMLLFLKKANPLYKDVTVNEDMLARLPADGMDPGMVEEEFTKDDTVMLVDVMSHVLRTELFMLICFQEDQSNLPFFTSQLDALSVVVSGINDSALFSSSMSTTTTTEVSSAQPLDQVRAMFTCLPSWVKCSMSHIGVYLVG